MKHFRPERPFLVIGLTLSVEDTSTATMTLESAHVSDAEPLDLVAVYQQWFRPVHRWIRALGGPNVEAEDLTQEVFIVVQRKLASFDGANLPGWLYRIAQLTVRDHRRRAWFRGLFLRARDVAPDDLWSPADGLDEHLARKHQEAQLYQLIDQIKPRWREVFLLFEVGGLSGDEIAGMLGIPPATVRTYLFRARKAMLALVAKRQIEGE
jgi:RNA polymerase sigma-70 factor, ECF subfamily